MAKIKYDVSNVEDGSDFVQAKPGMYIAKIEEINEKNSSNTGDPMLEIIFSITKDSKGKKVKERYSRIWHYVPQDAENASWGFRLKEFIKAVGLKLKGTLDTAKLVGTEVQIQLKADKDLNDEYRPKIGKVLALPDGVEADDEDDDDAGDDEADAGEGIEYADMDEDQFAELDNDELAEAAEELEVDFPTGKLTAVKKKKLIAALVAATESEDDDDDDDDDAGEDEDEDDGNGYDELSRNELIKEARSRGIKVTKSMKDGDIIAALEESDSEEEDDDDGDDDDEDSANYDDWDPEDLKKECKERGLKATGSKKLLVARLEKDDESDDDGDPF